MGKTISFNNLQEFLQLKVNLFKEAFDKGIIKWWTSEDKKANNTAGWISTLFGIFDKILPSNISMSTTALPYITSLIDDTSGRYISPVGTVIMVLFDVIINGIIDVGSSIIAAVASPLVGALASVLLSAFVDGLGTRDKAEHIAYNWYYLPYIWDLIF